MKAKTLTIAASVILCVAALPVYIFLTGILSVPAETVIPRGSIIFDAENREYARLSRFDINANGNAAKYFSTEKSNFTTWFSCFFGNGCSVSEQLANIIIPDSSPNELISAAKYLENEYTTEQLASMLCSAIEFNDGIYGVDNAAAYYFGISDKALSEAQLSALADIYRSDKYRAMTPVELSEEQHFSDVAFEKDFAYVSLYDDGYVSGVLTEIRRILNEQGISAAQADNMIFLDGVDIYTNLDTAAQKTLTEKLNSISSDKNIRAASQIMTYDGRIIACKGCINGDRTNRTISLLEPGSAIKPLSVYAPAFDANIISCSSLLPDYPFYPDEQWPNNFDHIFDIEVTTAKALRRSKNTTSVFVADRLTPDVCYEYLRRGGFKSITSNDITLMGMALGYMYSGVSLCEMNAAYAAFGNGGSYYKPSFIENVIHNGETIYTASHDGITLYSPETSYIMNRILKSNVDMGDGLGIGAHIKNIEVFGKTGTTDDNGIVDNNWFVGGTPELIAAVWTGPDDVQNKISTIPCTILWNQIIGSLPCEKNTFTTCTDIIETKYCTTSGLLISDSCEGYETGWYHSVDMPDICDSCGS